MSDDLTARARIRDAALRQFAERGYDGTTIRGIAAAADVSLGLVRHHFGSKEGLRDAVDAHVLAEIRRMNDVVMEDTQRGSFSELAISRGAIGPFFQQYVARALLDGSPLVAAMFDEIVGMTEDWLARADEHDKTGLHAERRWRAAVFTAMAMGVPLLRDHVSRALGVDILSPEGDRRVSLALLDIYSHSLITPELADAARTALERYHHGRTQ